MRLKNTASFLLLITALAISACFPAWASYIIPNGSVTQAKRAPLDQQLSSSSVAFTSSSTSPVNVTNLSVTIVTTGRPVVVGLISDGPSSPCSLGGVINPGSSLDNLVNILRDGSTIASYDVRIAGTVSSGSITVVRNNVPCSAVVTVDITPTAASHTYTIQAVATSGGSVEVLNAKLFAYEL